MTDQKLAAVVDYLDAALSLLVRPGELYANATDEQRRMLNQAVFSRIFVHVDDVTEVEFNEPFDMLMAAGELFENPTKPAPYGQGRGCFYGGSDSREHRSRRYLE